MRQNEVSWLHECDLGRKLSAKHFVFSGRVAAAGDKRQLVCEAVAAPIVSSANRFLLPVLQRVEADGIVMAAWICTRCCKTQCSVMAA